MTFAQACRHISNYTAAHESRIGMVGPERLRYPPKHIESDNRLSWFLGRLDQEFPDDVFYVHLQRERMAVARSYASRLDPGLIMSAWAHGIHLGLPDDIADQAFDIALDYVDTINANIAGFLAGRPNSMTFGLENAGLDLPDFWTRVGAQGDFAAALAEFAITHNAGRDSG
jgi:hypothetical protein